MPLEDNTCPLLPQPMQADTHFVSLVHVSTAGNEVPHHLYVAIVSSRVQRRPTILQVSTNTRKRQPFETFELITNEVCNHPTYTQWLDSVFVCVCEMCDVCVCVCACVCV